MAIVLFSFCIQSYSLIGLIEKKGFIHIISFKVHAQSLPDAIVIIDAPAQMYQLQLRTIDR